MRALRTVVATAATVSLCVTAAGCTPGDDAGAVSVLCSNDADICARWADDFTRTTGTSVSMVRLPTSEALSRLEHAGDEPEFDIWHGGPAEFYSRAAEEGLLDPYDPEGSSRIPVGLRDPGHLWTGVYASVLALCSDPAHLDRLGVPEPTTWEDLLDPRLRGLVVASSPRTSGTAYTLMFTQYQRLGLEGAQDYLRPLYAQVQQFTRSGTAPAGVVASGEAAVAITFSPYCSSPDRGTGHLRTTIPSDGTGYEVGAVALLHGAPHPAQARRYVDHAVSPQGQTASHEVGIDQLPTDDTLPGDISGLLEDPSSGILGSDVQDRAEMHDTLIGWFTDSGFDG
ncbi:MAG: ABC transporter substrate-binding protein [Pauljensenia sp.]